MDRLYLFFIGRIPGGTRCGAPPSGYKNETPGRGRVVQERKRLHFLILLVATVALIVCASAVYALYQAALRQQEQQLAEMVKSQARLIEAMFRHEQNERHTRAEIFDQIRDAFAPNAGFGETGGFMLARREGDRIVFLSSQRDEMRGHPESVPFAGTRAEPMRRALSGQSGVIVAADYRNVTVLAAYEPVRELGVGLVAKIDLAEVRAPYVQAGVIAGLVAALAVVFGGLFVVRATEPLLRRIRNNEQNLRALTENAKDGILVNLDGRHVYVNHRMAEMLGYAPEELLGTALPNLVHPDEWPKVEERYRRRLAGESVTSQYETVFIAKNGVRVPVEVNAARTEWHGRTAVLVVARNIGERKRIEETLRESSAMLATAQEMAHMGCWSFDIADDKVVWSDELYRLFGYEPGSRTPSYEMYVSHIHPDDRPRVVAAIAEARTHGGPFTYSYRLRRADGEVRIVESHGQTFANERGEVTRLFGVTQDVTERMQVEERIRDQARFSEQNPNPVLRARRDGKLLYGNEASGHLRDRLGIQTGDRLPPEWMAVLADAVKEQSPRTFEVACGDRHYLFIVRPIADADYVNFYGMDITERKRTEHALRDRETQYRAVIETTTDGFWVVDMEGRLREVNDAYVHRSGYTREELLGMRVTDVEARETPEEMAAHIAKVMRDGSDLFESWHRAKDGSLWPVEINVSHWPAAGGRLFMFLRDISARRASEAQTQQLSRALEQTADAVMITDRHGVIEHVNPALETMTGYSRAELIGRKPSVFRSGIQDEAFYRRLWDTILGGEIFNDVLVNRRKDGSLYYEEKLISPIKDGDGNITHFVATARDITERMAAQVRLAHLAHHDALTELPNRALFLDRLKQALARARWHGRLVAVIFLDLDRFKVINDTLGHDIGDRLLQQMSARLHSSVRARDTVARFGGDEFAILLDDVASENDIGHVARKVLETLTPAFDIEGRELYVSASLGISLYPNDGDDARTLLKNADTAMYRAKESGKNNYQFYSADMSAHALERLTLESSLRHALGRNEFTLHYQPQVDARTGNVLGVEALLRWRHPERGLVGPSDYIGLLEETGLILSVGEWALTTACEQLRAWHAAGWSDLRLAVNLSARQVGDPGFVGLLERLVAQHGCVAGKLELEITESVLMQHTRHALDNIEAAHRLGLRIALDDFGTGYSSLSYLQRFPIDTLKIDRSFIRDLPDDPDDALLTEAILNMARSLRIGVIAEGVETAAQRDFLSARGCHHMQGYLFGRPMPAAEIARRAPLPGGGVN